MSVIPTALVCILLGPARPSLLFYAILLCWFFILVTVTFFCETLIGPNHHEVSSRNMLNLELGISDILAILSRDCST